MRFTVPVIRLPVVRAASDRARTYTTEEQRRLHRGLESQVIAPQEVTFF